MEKLCEVGPANEDGDEMVLKGKMDIFGGITVHVDGNKNLKSVDEFDKSLEYSLAKWRKDGVKGVWIKISISDSDFIPIAVKHGFVFHHTRPDYIMLTQWLPKDLPNPLPPFGDNYIGVGGFVVDDQQNLLVVRENFFKRPHWKLPGGVADKGEDIPDVAVREVFEETGIKTEFVSLLTFRHLHQFRFGCADLYFICVMKPLNLDINFDELEIKDCQWMKIDDYIASPLVNDLNREIAQSYKNIFLNNSGSPVILAPKKVPSVVRGFQKVYFLTH